MTGVPRNVAPGIAVIESKRYGDEVAALAADPIVQDMAATVRGLDPAVLEGWDFMSKALDEYQRRGGTRAETIGGVARAIRRIIAGA